MKKSVLFLVAQLMFSSSDAININDVDINLLEGKKLCFFPGSFDPFHKGHEGMINVCLKEENYDYVIVSVEGESNFHKPNRTPPFHRRQIVDALFKNNPKVLTFLGSSRGLQMHLAPHIDHLHFVGLIGSDTLSSCFMREDCDRHFMKGEPIPEDNPDHGFASARVVFAQEFIVNMRESDKVDVSDSYVLYDGRKVLRVIKTDDKVNQISSTLIRKAYKENNKELLNNCLDKAVIEYILKHKLFES